MTLADALGYYGDAAKLVFEREHVGDSGTILRLAEHSGLSAYDCEFVAVAKGLGVPLITNDRKLCRSFPDTAVSPAEFLALQ
ncbi:MAG: type II toxin-antitoxin system VapC family toxin [Gemmatimonadaceae bacterium]|nr:type II toxin-antitoxin system VapC family toxin [Gemmatimonadaceae bacterium]